MLLELGVLRDEEREALVDAALLEELFALLLDADVKSAELRADVHSPAFPVSLGSEFCADLRVVVE